MNVGIAPLVLLFLALGLALASAPRSAQALSLLVLLATLAVPAPQLAQQTVLLGCLSSVVVTAASVFLVRRLGPLAALGLVINAGLWASSIGSRHDLLRALPCALIVWPASWVVRRFAALPVRVVSSWVIAVALLAVALQLLPVTPGYLPDHME